MKKLRKLLLFALTLGMAAAFAVSCGDNSGGNQGANSNSQQQSESVESTDSDESSSEIADSSDSDESSSEIADSSDSDESSSEIADSSDSDESSSEIADSSDSDESSSEIADSSDSDESSSDDGGEHVCITEGEWKGNSSGHWLVCTCGELVQYSSHSGTAPDCESQPICDTCDRPYGKAPGHTYGELSEGVNGKAYYCDCGASITNEDLVDFVVEVDDEPVVLQLSDTQIMNYGDLETLCYRYIREVVKETNPDLIILTGDVVYGKFDPNGSLLTSLINFMETLDTPWAPVFGNHDNESLKGVDWQCAQFEAAENCLFKQGDVTGNGNYSVGLENANGELLRVFYMMDSNGCSKPMIDSDGNMTMPAAGTNVVERTEGFKQDQINWYTNQINAIHAVDADVKISMAYHIQQAIFQKAFRKYEAYNGVTLSDGSRLRDPVNLDTLEGVEDTDFGYIGRTAKGPWDGVGTVFNGMKKLGVDSIFVGHEHCNSSSIVYEGVRFQYGQKSSQYDRYNIVQSDGTIVDNQMEGASGTPLMGGTVIPVSPIDGSIGTGYIAYYGDPFPEVHTHVTEGEWLSDENGHWLACDCEEKVQYAEHFGGTADCESKAVCEDCKEEYGEPKGHIKEGEWKSNASGHWLVCDCGEIVEYSTHSGTAADCGSKPVCDTCEQEYGEVGQHVYGELSEGANGKAYYCDCGAYITNKDLVDFVVEVDDEPVVLQLSDTQVWWWGDTAENQCYRYIREVVEKTNPDLIILTGDVVYGRFDPEGELLTGLITFMETLDIPWAPVFGNHDNESLMGVDWQCAQFEAAENCLFKQGDVTGNGNYSVGLEKDGELLRVFYMMDSNGCGAPMIDSDGNATIPEAGTNVVKTSQGFGTDQIDWYTEEINAIHAVDADVKISMAYHIQQAIFQKAFEKYDEYDGLTTDSALNNPLNLDTMETADETDFGYVGRPMKGGWDYDYSIFNGMKALGVDSIFVGHEHCNSSSIVYEGVRFQYGQKSSTYDRYNSVSADGTITGASSTPAGAHPIMGGTVIPVSSVDGSIGTGYICYYGDPFYFEPEPEPVIVEGLQYGTDITAQSDSGASFGTFKAVAYDENTNAYYIESGSSYNRIYINVDLLRGKTTVTFDILLPEEATNANGTATQEFAIRVKPNQTAETMPGVDNGYLWYDASYSNERKVVIGEWQTITIDISAYADACTEFGIYFVAGYNSAYVKNIAVS